VLKGAAGAFVGVEETSSGDWTLRVPIEKILPAIPLQPVKQQIRSIDFDMLRSDAIAFTFSLPVFWAIILAAPGVRRNLRPLLLGTVLMSAIELALLLAFAHITAHDEVSQLAGAEDAAGKWISHLGAYLVVAVLRRVLFYTLLSLVAAFFALPLLWLVFTPFDRHPGLSVKLPDFTLDSFRLLQQNPYALTSLKNSVLIAGATMLMVVVFAALAAYALSRVRIPGRDALLYSLLLLSSIVTGTAAMVPIFLLMFQINLIDSRTGVSLVLAGGLLPAAIFILKDFMDATPRSYEESARVFGASPLQVLRHVVLPIARPGLATVAVWAMVNAWGDFLVAFILLRDPEKSPAGVVMYTFYTEGGQANLPLISAFSLLYATPVVALYLFVSRRYGFRFYGGIKS